MEHVQERLRRSRSQSRRARQAQTWARPPSRPVPGCTVMFPGHERRDGTPPEIGTRRGPTGDHHPRVRGGTCVGRRVCPTAPATGPPADGASLRERAGSAGPGSLFCYRQIKGLRGGCARAVPDLAPAARPSDRIRIPWREPMDRKGPRSSRRPSASAGPTSGRGRAAQAALRQGRPGPGHRGVEGRSTVEEDTEVFP